MKVGQDGDAGNMLLHLCSSLRYVLLSGAYSNVFSFSQRRPLCSGAELEPESTDAHLLAQRLHAGGLPEGHRGAAHPQIPPSHIHTDREGAYE